MFKIRSRTMATISGVGSFPVPERTDPIDGPGAFVNLAAKLDDVTVLSFASAAARASAYSALNKTPVEGSVTFIRDTDSLQFYTGAVWTPVVPDSYPRGIVSNARLATVWPTDGSYITSGERMMDDLAVTCPVVSGRTYRISAYFGCVDGGSGTNLSSNGGQLKLRFNSSTTKPTNTSTQLATGRFMTVQNSSFQTSMVYVQRAWIAPGTGTYTFGIGVSSDNESGIRVLEYGRELIIEDIGMPKV